MGVLPFSAWQPAKDGNDRTKFCFLLNGSPPFYCLEVSERREQSAEFLNLYLLFTTGRPAKEGNDRTNF